MIASAVLNAAERARGHTDMERENLLSIGQAFLEAHDRVRDGLSIEVGTRNGGSAIMFAEILKARYAQPPALWTVDPYGSKPYAGGGAGTEFPFYSDAENYLAMKKALAQYEFHTHWKMERRTGRWRAASFLSACAG